MCSAPLLYCVVHRCFNLALESYLQLLQKQQLGEAEDLPEKDDEKPVVVVLKEGDLTAEEADKGVYVSVEVIRAIEQKRRR